MRFHADDAPPIPMARRLFGIDSFRVEGVVDATSVRATWDGSTLIVTNLLRELVELAMAVDDVFETKRWGSGPEEFMLAVLTCCDAIDLAEYEVGGARRVIAHEQ